MRVVSMWRGAMLLACDCVRAARYASGSTFTERRARFRTLVGCDICRASRDDRSGTARVAHHGSEYVFT
uniref:hypothetical protein n=1 Tax=Burkholderia multivorans TaxID=87883 RepID=UPI0021C0F0CC